MRLSLTDDLPLEEAEKTVLSWPFQLVSWEPRGTALSHQLGGFPEFARHHLGTAI